MDLAILDELQNPPEPTALMEDSEVYRVSKEASAWGALISPVALMTMLLGGQRDGRSEAHRVTVGIAVLSYRNDQNKDK